MAVALTARLAVASLVGLTLGCGEPPPESRTAGGTPAAGGFPVPVIDWNPRTYDAPYAPDPPVIDGRLDDEAWALATQSAEFVDIEGPSRPAPTLSTRMRMAWDTEFLYVAAEMEEPHLWATLTDRDAVIYLDNDFEVFIDPDGDTHEYYELEINALGTEWDLFLVRPYRDGGPALHAWDIPGLRTAVALDGTLNDPGDVDRGWTVEIAIPWAALGEAAHRPAPPEPGDAWRVNFSRVQWTLDPVAEGYVKRTDESGEPLPEHNWVWSPQGLINMHYPEMWGFVRFVRGVEDGAFEIPVVERARWALRTVYYAQRAWQAREGDYAVRIEDVLPPTWPADLARPILYPTRHGYEAVLTLSDGAALVLTADGRIRALEP